MRDDASRFSVTSTDSDTAPSLRATGVGYMKRFAHVSLLLIPVLTLVGCATEPATPEALFATSLSSEGIEPTEQLAMHAQAACTQFKEGTDPKAVAVVFAMRASLQLQQAGQVLEAGVRAFCPEQKAAVDAIG